MNIRQTILNWLTQPTGRKNYTNYIDYAKSIQSMGTSYGSYALDGYMSNPDVFACIREIATAIRGINLTAYRTASDGKLERIEQHPLLTLLNNPNSYESGASFREKLISYHLIGGRAYILRVGANDTRRPPQALYLLRPDSIIPIEGDSYDRPIAYYQYTSKGGAIDLPLELVMDMPVFNPLDMIGSISPMQPTATSIDSGVLGRSWNKNLIGNSARPSGVFSADLALTDAQYERLQQDVESRYGGTGNAGRPMLLEGGLKWQSISLSPSEMDWLNGIKLSTVDICRVYNVPPELIGDATAKTYSNYQEARVAFYEETILPLLDMLCEEFNRWLSPLYGGGVVIGYDKNDIEALQENRDAIYARIKDAWWLTPNERRAECGMQTAEDVTLDRYYIPSNLIPIELAGTQTITQAPTPTGDKSYKKLNPMTEQEFTLSAKVEEALSRVRADTMKELSE